MRPTIILLATMAFALLVVGGVATGQQQQQSTSPAQAPTTTTDKSSGDVTIQSSTQKASFTNGSGANFLGVKVSDHGNLLSFVSPAPAAGVDGDAVWQGNEGYVVCSANTIDSYDNGSYANTTDPAAPSERGFDAPTFVQPTAGAFPLTVTRNTTDGKFQLKQVWAKPDPTEKDVTVTMTLTNRTSSSINSVLLTRTGEFDVGATGSDRGAATRDSVWQWDDVGGPDNPPGGLRLTPLTFGTPHIVSIEQSSHWLNGSFGFFDPTRTSCGSRVKTTPTEVGDYAMKSNYSLGTLNAGQSKTVKFEYSRM